MKNEWIPNITGNVRLKVQGKYPELFINRCTSNNVQVWNVKRIDEDTLLCSLKLDEVSHLRKIARTSGCKITFIEKNGLPFLTRKVWKRKGFLIGSFVFLLCLFILSNMVWGIEIEGASPQVEHQLNQSISEIGIKKGALQFFLPAPQDIQTIITDEIADATWIGVEKRGTTYHFQVVEKEIAEREPKDRPGHIVASRKALIHDLFIEKGQPLVEINDFVKRGDLLVSGLIGREGEEKRVAAKGSILGEMWYETKVKIPLNRTRYIATGEKDKRYELIIANWSIPIFGFKDPDFAEWKEEIDETNWNIFGMKLPIQISRKNILEVEKKEKELSIEEAIYMAKDKGRNQLLTRFSNKAEIIGEKVLHHEEEDGKVKIIIHYRIVDEIGIKQPIIQGD